MKLITRYITPVACVFTITVSCFVLAGWFFNIPVLTTLFIGSVSIKVNLAICFLLTGIAFYLPFSDSLTPSKKNLALFCAWIVLIPGLLTFSQFLSGWNLSIDELLWKTDTLAPTASFNGRMSMMAAIISYYWAWNLPLLISRKYNWPAQAVFLFAIHEYFLSNKFAEKIFYTSQHKKIEGVLHYNIKIRAYAY